jgi:hypothetical protein
MERYEKRRELPITTQQVPETADGEHFLRLELATTHDNRKARRPRLAQRRQHIVSGPSSLEAATRWTLRQTVNRHDPERANESRQGRRDGRDLDCPPRAPSQ